MLDNPRRFDVTDPFGRQWSVTLRWHQNAISIRHADAVDVRFELLADDGNTMDKVIALHHPFLIELAKRRKREITDPWCMRLAGAHLRYMIETWEDAEKTLVTPALDQLDEHSRKLEPAASLPAAPSSP